MKSNRRPLLAVAVLGAVLAAGLPLWVGASSVSLTSFTNGEVADAAAVNQNFANVNTELGALSATMPYVRLLTTTAASSNGSPGVVLSGWTFDESRGKIGFDGTGITIQEAGLYVIGYSIGVLPQSGGNHGWMETRGLRVASWSYPGAASYFSASSPMLLNVNDQVRIRLWQGDLIVDGNPRVLYAYRIR